MVQRLDLYEDDLIRLFDVTMHFDNFSHLNQWEDAEAKTKRARDAVAALRSHALGFFKLKQEQEQMMLGVKSLLAW